LQPCAYGHAARDQSSSLSKEYGTMRYRPFPASALDHAAEKRVVIGGFTPVAGIFLPVSANVAPITLAATTRSVDFTRRAAGPIRRSRRIRSV
jgi:hypothetical protein